MHRALAAASIALLLALVPAAAEDVRQPPTGDASCDDTFDPQEEGRFSTQSVTCAFVCGANNILLVLVDAVDEDASVTGKAKCADERATCNGQKSCEATSTGLTRYAGSGTCEGSADEFWNSGVTIECRAEPNAATGQICINGLTCPRQSQTQGNRAWLTFDSNGTSGFVCDAYCRGVVPRCSDDGARRVCAVGFMPNTALD